MECLGGALVVACGEVMHQIITAHQQVKLALKKGIRMEEILLGDRLRTKLPTAAAGVFLQRANHLWLLVDKLAMHFSKPEQGGPQTLQLTIKRHYLKHAALTAGSLNPALSWSYQGEDLMHHGKVLMQSFARGDGAVQCMTKFLHTYRCGLGLVLGDAWHK